VTTSTAPSIQSSELKGLRVLFLHPDTAVCEEFEARAEQTLSRVEFFATSSLQAGRDLLKRNHFQLAIFQDGVDGKDFVFAQLEIKNVVPGINMIPLIDVPTIDQLSAQRRIGGIHSFGKKVDTSSFDYVTSLILNFARDSSKTTSLQEQLEYGKTLQKFLFARTPTDQTYKTVSQRLMDNLILQYDWNPQECTKLITAETIYCPEVRSESYSELLGSDKYGLVSWLAQTASWKISDSKPSGSGGMLITLVNYLAATVNDGTGYEEAVARVFERPHFLFHPSIRTLNKASTTALLKDILETSNTVLKAVGDGN
jgi:hypothetical protein